MPTTCQLEARGFPKKIPVIGTRDRKAVDAWLDMQGGLETATQDFNDAWMLAAGNGQI